MNGTEPAGLDPRTGRPWGDHGSHADALNFALDHAGTEQAEFLRAWRYGDLGEWPEYYEWLAGRGARGEPNRPPTTAEQWELLRQEFRRLWEAIKAAFRA